MRDDVKLGHDVNVPVFISVLNQKFKRIGIFS